MIESIIEKIGKYGKMEGKVLSALDESNWSNDEYIPNIEEIEKAVTLGERVRFLFVYFKIVLMFQWNLVNSQRRQFRAKRTILQKGCIIHLDQQFPW